MTPIEWTAFFVLLVAVIAYGAAVTLSNGAVTQAIRRLEATYRRQKSQEMEQARQRELTEHVAQLRARLAGDSNAWRDVVAQLLVDAGADGVATRLEMERVSADPAPCYTIGGGRWHYLFTTNPARLREARLVHRSDPVVSLDTALSPFARVEAQALWDYFAQDLGAQARLPRDVMWYLVAHREAPLPRARRKR